MIAVLLALALQAGTPAPPPPAARPAVVEGIAGGTLTLVAPAPTDPARATLILSRADGFATRYEVAAVDTALLLLADPRLAPLWPDLLAWAGTDLTRLRDADLARAQAIAASGRTQRADTTAASSVRPPVRAALLLADALWRAGRRDEAERVVAAVRGAAPGKGDWGLAEWTMTSLRMANLRQERGDTAGALALLDASAVPLGGSPYALNMQVNRAVYLLDADRAAAALAEIDAAMAAFGITEDGRGKDRGEKVPGSDRQFAWIRACALHKLGRTAEAAAAATALAPTTEPRDDALVVEPTAKLRLRYARCIGDVAMAARVYAEELRSGAIGGSALVDLQPERRADRIDPAFNAAVRRHPSLAPLLAERMRELPPALHPALQGWRTGN